MKEWRVIFYVLVREVKILRAKAKKFGLWVKLQAVSPLKAFVYKG
ncbi:DUF1661 domain-containing protein [Porphyromonas gingivalis]|nr:DUF1661 domain-containing protein [Porphyromonas gingivalis]